MSRLTDAQIEDVLRALAVGRSHAWGNISHRLRRALRKVETDSDIDGYPTSSGFDGGGSSHGAHADPTQRAALARVGDGGDPEVDALIRTAIRKLYESVNATDALVGALDELDALTQPKREAGCAVLGEYRIWAETYRPITYKGKKLEVSRWVYDFYRKHERLPTQIEAEHHAAGGRIR